MPTIKIPAKQLADDILTGAPRGLSELRHLVHEGRVFVVTETAELFSNGTLDLVLSTGPDPEEVPHMLNNMVWADRPGCTVDIFVNPTFTGGSSESVFNLNFQSDRTSQTTATLNPTITDPGNRIARRPVPPAFGTYDDPAQEAVLAPDTDYLLRVEVAQPSVVRIALRWFEQQRDFDEIVKR